MLEEARTEAEHTPPLSVFLSYARDDQVVAKKIIAALEAQGFAVWWDGLLQGGAAFANQTEEALENADAVVVLWSKISAVSHWVRDEATVGRQKARLVPATLDGTEAPLGFRQFQLLDLSKWKGQAGAPEIEGLCDAIRLVAGQEAAPHPLVPARFGLGRRQALLIGGGVALAASGYGIWRSGLLGLGELRLDDSVAVIPFRNLSSDAEQGYFAQGLSEEIRLALSRNSALRVIAPASTKAAGEEDAGPAEVARKLGVAWLLRGSVRASGDTLRIAAELVDGKTGAANWTDSFDRARGDVFAVQSEIASSVASALSAQATGAAAGKTGDSGTGGTGSVKAYDAYLRGNAYYELRSGEAAFRAALGQYDTAIAADPDYAQAHAARAQTLTVVTNNYARADQFAAQYGDAIKSARRAVAIAPDMAVAHSVLGFVLLQGMLDIGGAKAPYEKSRALGAGDASVQRLYAAFAAQMGEDKAAREAIGRAIALDPLNAAVFRVAGFIDFAARRFDKALESCGKAVSLNPDMAQIGGCLGDAHYQLEQFEAAKAAYLLEPAAIFRNAGLAVVEHKLGNRTAAVAANTALVEEFGDGSAYQQAQIAAQWGDPARALAMLRLAQRVGDIGLVGAKIDAMLDPLRQQREFSSLLNQLGFG